MGIDGNRLVPRIARLPLRGWGLALLALLAFALAAVMFVRARRESSTVALTVSSGIMEGQRSEALAAFVELAVPHGLVLRPLPTSGSADAIERVDSGKLDLATVVGGIDFSSYPNARQVTSLQVLPLHLLVKEEIAVEVSTHLGSLRGKVVNLGASANTGTHRLARDILEFAGLDIDVRGQPDDYRASTLSALQLAALGDRARLPDAIFLVAPLPSPLVRQLVERHGYRLVPLLFRDAFALGAIAEPGQLANRTPKPQAKHSEDRPSPTPAEPGRPPTILREYIVDTVIPAFTYQADPGVPSVPLHTLGVKALLIANRRVDPEVVGRILHVLFQTRYAKLSQPVLDLHRLEEIPELPWHPGSDAYLERSKPVLTGESVSELVNLLGIAGPVCGGVLFLWQSYRQRRRFRSEQGFEAYIARVSALEQAALQWGQDGHGVLDEAELARLWRELATLKAEALDRFARGDLTGEAMLTSFLTHVSDARAHLAHMTDTAHAGRPPNEPPEAANECQHG
jgi:TRAP-type uncharacterized transport system substrate-binding protein